MRDAYEDLTKKGVKVVGVSMDKQADQATFKKNNKLPFPLIADSKGKVVDAFGVPKIAGGKFASRQAFLFKDGKLVWRDLKASTKEQAADVLKALKELDSKDAAESKKENANDAK